MEEAQKIGLTNVWLECDSALVCDTFTARTNVPWMLRNQWNTYLNYCGKIKFRVTHIFPEKNACADKLANLGFIHRKSFHWYNRLQSSLFLEFFMNRYSLLMYRFCYHMGFGLVSPYFLFCIFFIFFNNTFFMWWEMIVVRCQSSWNVKLHSDTCINTLLLEK